MSIYSNTETSLAMSTLAVWCRVVQSRHVSPHNFDGLTISGLAFSVAPYLQRVFQQVLRRRTLVYVCMPIGLSEHEGSVSGLADVT